MDYKPYEQEAIELRKELGYTVSEENVQMKEETNEETKTEDKVKQFSL
jgi:hypothetical protein